MVRPAGARLPRFPLVAIAMACALVVRSPAFLRAHPLHTTISELSFRPATKEVRMAIRVFADDLSSAIVKRRGGRPQVNHVVADSDVLAYVRSTVTVVGTDGRALALASCGNRPMNDLLVLCFTAVAPGGPSTLRLRQGMLLELYDDQVNVVQTTYGRRRHSLLFTRSSATQALP